MGAKIQKIFGTMKYILLIKNWSNAELKKLTKIVAYDEYVAGEGGGTAGNPGGGSGSGDTTQGGGGTQEGGGSQEGGGGTQEGGGDVGL